MMCGKTLKLYNPQLKIIRSNFDLKVLYFELFLRLYNIWKLLKYVLFGVP